MGRVRGLLLGRGRHAIIAIRLRLGIAAGGGTYDHAPAVKPELVERIRMLAGEGWSDERIGREIGRSRLQVMRLRKRLRIGAGNPQMGQKVRISTLQIAAEARRDAHIAMLRERKAVRRAAEMERPET